MIDVLFLPFVLPIPLSAAILPVWFFLAFRFDRMDLAVICGVGVIFAVISYLWGRLAPIRFDLDTMRLVNTFIIVFMFVSYHLMRTARVYEVGFILALLRAYIFFVFGLALVYFADPFLYFQVRGFWAFSSGDLDVGPLSVLTRFTGTLSDPNNMAVAICAVTAAITSLSPKRVVANVVAIGLTGIIVVATMSATGAICYAALLVAFALGSRLSAPVKVMSAILCVAAVAAAYFVVRDTMIFTLASERFAASDVDSRLSRWVIGLDPWKWLSSLIVGDGGTVIWKGVPLRPHNGHFHLVFSFGLICYLAFVYLFFRVPHLKFSRPPLFLLLLLVGFTVNVGIYEHRFAGIWVILLAAYGYAHASARVRRPRRAHGRTSSRTTGTAV